MRLPLASCVAFMLLVVSCSGADDTRPPAPAASGTANDEGGASGADARSGGAGPSAGSSSTGGSAASSSGAGGGSGDASGRSGGAGGSSGGAQVGQGGATEAGSGNDGGAAGAEPVCGNGEQEIGEECDGSDLGNSSCEELGFSSGTLGCRSDCSLDTAECAGQEDCFDGGDNDGNGLIDCSDPSCEEACASSCAAAVELSEPTMVVGNTRGHSAELEPSCSNPTEKSGSELVYRVTAQNDGVLAVSLATAAPQLTLSLRQTCAADASEVLCSTAGTLVSKVNAGDVLFVVVDGYSPGDAGKFTLSVESRAIRCGDAVRDEGEGCDDGGQADGDGCSATCTVESSESDDNDSLESADEFVPSDIDYYYAEISEPGDVDWVKVQVNESGTTLEVTTRDFGDGACGLELLDSDIAIYDANGTLLVENDDSLLADGLCAYVLAENLAAGSYYIRVMASPVDPELVFPYALQVNIR